MKFNKKALVYLIAALGVVFALVFAVKGLTQTFAGGSLSVLPKAQRAAYIIMTSATVVALLGVLTVLVLNMLDVKTYAPWIAIGTGVTFLVAYITALCIGMFGFNNLWATNYLTNTVYMLLTFGWLPIFYGAHIICKHYDND